MIGAYCESDYVTSQLLQIVKPIDGTKAKTLLGILNSSLMAYYFRKKYNRQDKTFPEIRIYELASLPIARTMSPAISRRIDKLVDQITEAQSCKANVKAQSLEGELDQVVYELYGLSSEDVKIVEDFRIVPGECAEMQLV